MSSLLLSWCWVIMRRCGCILSWNRSILSENGPWIPSPLRHSDVCYIILVNAGLCCDPLFRLLHRRVCWSLLRCLLSLRLYLWCLWLWFLGYKSLTSPKKGRLDSRPGHMSHEGLHARDRPLLSQIVNTLHHQAKAVVKALRHQH